MKRILGLGLTATLLLAPLASPAPAQTQLEMNLQAHGAAKRVDADLNKHYKALMGQLDPRSRALLVKAELKWIAFRDAECEFEQDKYRGGSIQPTIYWGAYSRMTQTRLEHLAARGPGEADPKADATLNRLYQELARSQDGPGKKRLLKAQLAWLAFRDADAAFQAARYRAPQALGLARLTASRNQELQMELNALEERP